MKAYETPKITELGTVADFTRGAGGPGEQDDLIFFTWGNS